MPPIHAEPSTPRAFKCPLTGETFKEPILEADGHTYEKAALDAWGVAHKGVSPLTREALPNLPRVPNATLARALREYQEHRNSPADMRDEWRKNLECPINYEPLKNPVLLSDGHDYSLETARELVDHGRSPFTNKTFRSAETARPNHALGALSYEVVGAEQSVYPSHLIRLEQNIPAKPMPIAPPDATTAKKVNDYLVAYGLEQVIGQVPPPKLEDELARAQLIHYCKTEIHNLAPVIVEHGHRLLRLESRWYGLGQLADGLKIWLNLSFPNPYLRELQATARTSMRFAQCFSILHAHDEVDTKTSRFDENFGRFTFERMMSLQHRLRTGRSALFAAVGATVAAWDSSGVPFTKKVAAAQCVFYGTKIALEVGFRTLIASGNRPIGEFRGEQASAQVWDVLAKAPNLVKLGFAWALDSTTGALVGAGVGTAVGAALPAGYVTAADGETHYAQLMKGLACLGVTLVTVSHIGVYLSQNRAPA